MKIALKRLEVITRQTTEAITMYPITFIHGPVGSGKSTVARLIDFCFGGDLVATPAIQSEFVAARLVVTIGKYEALFERNKTSGGVVRVTWESVESSRRRALSGKDEAESQRDDGPRLDVPQSVLAPLIAEKGVPIIPDAADVENLSDLIFHLAGVRPIQVRRSKQEPDAKLVRLSFRDLLVYCYLDQDHLDSSFFAFEHPFRRQKSIDALRFVVGFHSERLNELERRYQRALEEQRTKRGMAEQLSQVLRDLDFDNDVQIAARLAQLGASKAELSRQLAEVENARRATTHPLDDLRAQLRKLNQQLVVEERALSQLQERVAKRVSLRAELLTAKMKALRVDAAERVLTEVSFQKCPQCDTVVEPHRHAEGLCPLCGMLPGRAESYEELAGECDERIDDLDGLIARQQVEVTAQERRVAALRAEKKERDARLEQDARRYDAAFVARLRELERGIAELNEREKNLVHLRRIPEGLAKLVREAGQLQGEIDAAKRGIEEENSRLRTAQTVVDELSQRFRQLLLKVHFPGMAETDRVEIDTRTWEPQVSNAILEWGFNDLGSGGKKVLFKVLYALALHEVAARRGLPLPSFLIVDSPTKNISQDVNPELFGAFYREVYRVAQEPGSAEQFVLIDSDLVPPPTELGEAFGERLLDHTEDAPPLISYYQGP